jgi:hypothetical protein
MVMHGPRLAGPCGDRRGCAPPRAADPPPSRCGVSAAQLLPLAVAARSGCDVPPPTAVGRGRARRGLWHRARGAPGAPPLHTAPPRHAAASRRRADAASAPAAGSARGAQRPQRRPTTARQAVGLRPAADFFPLAACAAASSLANSVARHRARATLSSHTRLPAHATIRRLSRRQTPQ